MKKLVAGALLVALSGAPALAQAGTNREPPAAVGEARAGRRRNPRRSVTPPAARPTTPRARRPPRSSVSSPAAAPGSTSGAARSSWCCWS